MTTALDPTCAGCDYAVLPRGDGWCYMFRARPDVCGYRREHTGPSAGLAEAVCRAAVAQGRWG